MTYEKHNLSHWAMLPTDMEKIKHKIMYPVLAQEKLNGIRVKWDAEKQLFISRDGQIFPIHIIPHLYKQFLGTTLTLDGELYHPQLSLQTIVGIVNIHRKKADENNHNILFYAFDTISTDDTLTRQQRLPDFNSLSHGRSVRGELLSSVEQIDQKLEKIVLNGGEGLVLRQLDCPYIVGRTEAVIKVKPWRYNTGIIVGFKRGTGRHAARLGAIRIRLPDNNTVFAGGGPNLNDAARDRIWTNQAGWFGVEVKIRYRELSLDGIPLQPQLLL